MCFCHLSEDLFGWFIWFTFFIICMKKFSLRRIPGGTGLRPSTCNFLFYLDEAEYSIARGRDQASRFVISIPKD